MRPAERFLLGSERSIFCAESAGRVAARSRSRKVAFSEVGGSARRGGPPYNTSLRGPRRAAVPQPTPRRFKGSPALVHLRFTPQEYRAIRALCREIHLRDDLFPIFRYFLAEALHERWPTLAGRVALLGEAELRLLF